MHCRGLTTPEVVSYTAGLWDMGRRRSRGDRQLAALDVVAAAVGRLGTDLEQFPIHELDRERGRQFVRECRKQLATEGVYVLTGSSPAA